MSSTVGRIARYLDDYLKIHQLPDYRNALNGLQVEGGAQVERIAAAVDASEASIRAAIDAGCQLLVVHHGLFWDGKQRVVGRRYRRLKLLLAHDVALYSVHLPLDVHPEVGNNAILARELGVRTDGHFGSYDGVPVGVTGELNIDRDALAERLADALGGRVHTIAGGPQRIRRVGVLTGGGGSMIGEAVAAGLDALVTGEGAHHTHFDAIEGGINVFYGGHYATETWGVRALVAHLTEEFGIESTFIDLPTGL